MKSSKKKKRTDEDQIWHFEAKMYHEAIDRDKKRNIRDYIT